MKDVETAARDVAPVDRGVNAASLEGARRVLSRLSICRYENWAHLTPEERDRCSERARAGYGAAKEARLNLDPAGRYAEKSEPYLNRRPVNGCKPRAAGDVGPRGAEGVRVGLGCALSF